MIESLIEFYRESIEKDDIDCFRMELKVVDPYSRYVSGIKKKKLNKLRSKCMDVVNISGIDTHIMEIEKTYGDLSTLTGKKGF